MSDDTQDFKVVSRAQVRAERQARLVAESKADGTYEAKFPTRDPQYSLTVGEAMRQGLILQAPEPEPVVEGKLASLAHEINTRFQFAERADTQANDHRLTAAIRLGEAKTECERLKINFRAWAEGSIPQSYETVRKLAAIGQAPNPQEALIAWREDNARRNRVARERKALEHSAAEALQPTEVERPTESFRDNVTRRFGANGTANAQDAEEITSSPQEPPPAEADATSPPEIETPTQAPEVAELQTAETVPAEAIFDPVNVVKDALKIIENLQVDADLRRTVADEAAARLPIDQVMGHIKALAEERGLSVIRGKGKKFQPTIGTLKSDFETLSLVERSDFAGWVEGMIAHSTADEAVPEEGGR